MADIVSPEVRSRMMAGIRGKDTKPEMKIRRGLHSLGYRYNLHVNSLPGKPDLVFQKYGAVIFVNGCFWHGHDCHLFKWPSSREEFWRNKIDRTIEKDKEVLIKLLELDWRVLVIWECALKGKEKQFLEEVLLGTIEWLNGNLKFKEVRGLQKK